MSVLRFLFGLAILVAVAVGGAVGGARPSLADTMQDCFSEDFNRRIQGCTELIERGTFTRNELSGAYSQRALAYSMKGRHDQAIRDYDRAIELMPDNAVALNNRAWSYFRSGHGSVGLKDVEASLRLGPDSGASYDTRAHIRQTMGNRDGAIMDYDMAMRFGGEHMIKMYQCGLTERKFYKGPTDGIWSPELRAALVQCVRGSDDCDPLPADEQCKAATS
jgi:tetratricopeptide (TPR) repeat protein